jgi:cation transport regulator ChaB
MVYKRIEELPAEIKYGLPMNVQEAYLVAYNRAWESMQHQKDSPAKEELAHQAALESIQFQFPNKTLNLS